MPSLTTERNEAENRLKNRNDHYFWVHERGKVSERKLEGEPQRMVGMSQNITKRKSLKHRLQQMASHDDLTFTMNRLEGELNLEKQITYCQFLCLQLSICLFELDHFKKINEIYGQLTGAQILKKVATIATAIICTLDYFYRWGGEEFVLALPDTAMDQRQIIAEKTRPASKSYPWKKKLSIAAITASFGLSVFPQHCIMQQDLILDTDVAMFQVKSSDRNCVVAASLPEKLTFQLYFQEFKAKKRPVKIRAV